MTRKLPALFLGSSIEGLNTAYAIQQALDYDAEPTVWSQGLFEPSQCVLFELVKSLSRFEFAVLTSNAARSDGNLCAALGPACNEIRNAIKLHAKAAASARLSDREQSLAPSTENSPEKLQRYLDSWNGEVLREAEKADIPFLAALPGALRRCSSLVWLATRRSERLALHPASAPKNGILTISASLTKARELVRMGVPMSRIEVDESSHTEWDAFIKIYYFLESVSAAILAGEIQSDAAKKVFGEALPSIWKHACTALAMPNHVEDSWNPLPHIAQVSERWRGA